METRKIKFVYFDIGGVLLNWRQIRRQLFKLTNCDWDEFYQIFLHHDTRACRGEITPAQLWQEYKKEFAIQDPIDNFSFLEYWTDGFVPYKASHLLLEKISRTFPFGYLTNIYSGVFAKQLEKKKIPGVKYSTAVQSSDLGVVKPRKEIFDIAIKQAGFPPEEIFLLTIIKKIFKRLKSLASKFFCSTRKKYFNQWKKLENYSICKNRDPILPFS